MTSQNDGKRGESGVVASLIERPDGTLRLVLDDVSIAPSMDATLWRSQNLYTFMDWPRDGVEKMSLRPEDYQALGENLIARLLAQGRAVVGYSVGRE